MQESNMVGEGPASGRRCLADGFGPPPDEGLLHLGVAGSYQSVDVAAEVAIRRPRQPLQPREIEASPLGGQRCQGRHDPKPR